MKIIGLFFALTFGLAMNPVSSVAAPTYPTYTVDALPTPSQHLSRAYGLDDTGSVVGSIRSLTDQTFVFSRAVLWRNGQPHFLGTARGFTSSDAVALNNHGQVAGTAGFFFNGAYMGTKDRAFRWHAGHFHLLQPLGECTDTEAVAMNDAGDVAGVMDFTSASRIDLDTPWTQAAHAFLFENGCMNDLGVGNATCINAHGQVGGYTVTDKASGKPDSAAALIRGPKIYTALLWDRGKVQRLGGGRVNGINNHGQAVGDNAATVNVDSYSTIAKGDALLWDGNKEVDLGTLDGGTSSAWAINDQAQIVGTSIDAQKHSRAFFWDRGIMRDLNALIPSTSGWVLEEARGINARGQIVGWGFYHGQERAFLLTPVKGTATQK